MPLARIADKLVLRPTTHAVEAEGATRLLVPFEQGHVEVWTQRTSTSPESPTTHLAPEPELFLLKFVGNAGRAERAGSQPANYWRRPAEVWSVNIPGYGGSTGPAGLRRIAPAAQAVWATLERAAAGRPIVISGNSLGTTAALHLAATRSVAGLILRNPVPLPQLFVRRHGWWNLWLPAMLLASSLPPDLNSVRNSPRAKSPAIFITSALDRTVPPRLQERIIAAYGGEKRLLTLHGLDHHTTMTNEQEHEYAVHLDWLLQSVFPSAPVLPSESPGSSGSALAGSSS